MQNNAFGSFKGGWQPDKNLMHRTRSEISDVYKAMYKIRQLERKLKNYDPNSGTTNADWNLLNSLKRELDIPVEMEAQDNKKFNTDGQVPSKMMAAN